MANFTPIAFASAGWDKKINEALTQIFAGGVIEDSGWVACATLINGALPYSGTADKAIKRRVIDFGRFKFIKIHGSLSFPRDEIPSYTDLILLPPGLGIHDEIDKILPATGSRYARWKLNDAGTMISIIEVYPVMPFPESTIPWFDIDFAYISQ